MCVTSYVIINGSVLDNLKFDKQNCLNVYPRFDENTVVVKTHLNWEVNYTII